MAAAPRCGGGPSARWLPSRAGANCGADVRGGCATCSSGRLFPTLLPSLSLLRRGCLNMRVQILAGDGLMKLQPLRHGTPNLSSRQCSSLHGERLADRLAEAHRGLFVPARPDKSIVEGQVMQRHDFVSQRCVTLQRYLRRLAAHPVVGRSPDLHAFLTEPSGIPTSDGESPRWSPAMSAPSATSMAAAAPPMPTKSGRDFFGVFKDLKQTVTNGWVAVRPPPVEEEIDTKYLAHKAKLEDLEQHLVTASQQGEALLKSYDDLRTTTGLLGMSFIKLAKFEKEQATCTSQKIRAADISNFANAVVRVSRSQTKLNAEIVKHLGIIHEYMETMAAVHNAFTDRSNSLLRVQNLSADLYFLHTRAGKLESVSSRGMDQERSRYQKIEELKETIRTTEDAKTHALKELELIKENNMKEIKRFNKKRCHDLVEMLKGFVSDQAAYSDHFASVWTKVAEDTKGYVNRSS